MPRAIDVSVDARQFHELFGAASQVDKALRMSLRKNIRMAAKVAVAQVQAEVQKPPEGGLRHRARLSRRDSFGAGATPLRVAIARGIKVQMPSSANSKRVGVFIRATSGSLTGSRKKLVRKWDKGEFKHPVFGDRSTWATQQGRPYFGSVIRKHRADVAAAVTAAMKEALASLSIRNP